MGQMACQLPALADAETPQRAALPGVDQRPGPLASAPADQLLVFLGEPPPCAEQGAFHDGPRHAQAITDLAVGETLELAEDEDAVVEIRNATERGT